MRDDRLARRMFYGGCALLPWLWIVNTLYYRKRVYGPFPVVDYWPGGGRRQQAEAAIAEGRSAEGGQHGEDGQPDIIEGITGGRVRGPGGGVMGGIGGGNGDETESEFNDDDATAATSTADNADSAAAASSSVVMSPEALDVEVIKWVKRSTMGASGVLSLFVAWILVFQLNKDSFAPGWFVMSEDEGEKTGW